MLAYYAIHGVSGDVQVHVTVLLESLQVLGSRMLADARTVFDRPVAPGGLFARSECVLSDHRAAHQLAGLQRYRTGLRTRCSVGEGGRTTMGDLVW